jgi:hypothetical protein
MATFVAYKIHDAMSFIDPYDLLGLQVTDPQAVTDAMVHAGQAQLQQTIQAATGPVINIGGKGILVADAIALSQAMDDAQSRQLFWEMRQLTGLHVFLQVGAARELPPILMRTTTMGTAFHAFASTWIARRIDEALGAAIASGKWVDAVQWARGAAKLHPLSEPAAMLQTTAFFEQLIAELSAGMGNPILYLSEASFKRFHHSAMLGLLNSLPMACQAMRDDYAVTLGDAVMASATAHSREPWTYAIAEAASRIKVSANLQGQSKFMLQTVKDESGITAHEERQARQFRQRATWGGVALVGAIFLRIMVRILLH